MLRPRLASEQNVKRSASAPKPGMPFGNSAAVSLRIARRGLGPAQAGRALLEQRLERDAVDQVDRVEHVAFRLAHLLALRVAHQAVDVDVAERHLAGEVHRHHDHPGDPEEDDVVAGDEHASTAGTARAPSVFFGQPSDENGTSADEYQVSSTSGSRVSAPA